MTKLSIDLNPQEGGVVSADQLASITNGCLETLKRLGKLGEMVEVFRVTWVCGLNLSGLTQPGPQFTVYFHDPLGKIISHTVDYRFIGKGRTQPSREEIVGHLCSEGCLPLFISRHLEDCKTRMEKATELLSKVALPR